MKNLYIGLIILMGMNSAIAVADIAGVTPELASLITRCAPSVHPETMAAVISAESRGHPYAIADAGPVNLPWSKRKHLVRSFYEESIEKAVLRVNELLSKGHTVSMGPAQVNDRNLKALGMTVKDAFDSCKNLAAGGYILTEFYIKAAERYGYGSSALRAALSAYNSGSFIRGEKDGYVDLVLRQRGKPLGLKIVNRNNKVVHVAPKKITYQREFSMAANNFLKE